MARQPMVTRTILSTKATALCINTTTAEPYNETFLLSRTYKDKKAIEKALSKTYDNDEHKVVSVVDVEVIEKRYGMTEQEFINSAKEMPPLRKAE